MGLLDNIDEQLKDIQRVSESLKVYKKLKVRNIKTLTEGHRTPKQKHVRLGNNYYKKIKKHKNVVRYRTNRCPKTYQLYITSKWWIERKNRYYQNNKRICTACGSFEHIVLHHMVYKNYGNEKDTHLTPLCQNCHSEFHRTYLLKKDMIKSTLQFIENKKQLQK